MGFRDIFKRKKDIGVVDLTNLQKRGIYKPKQEVSLPSSSAVLDLSSSDASKDEGTSALGFLGNLAAAGNESSVSSSTDSSTDFSSPSPYVERKQKLKGVLRDIKGQVDNVSDKVYRVSDRLDLIEKKLERLERRAGL